MARRTAIAHLSSLGLGITLRSLDKQRRHKTRALGSAASFARLWALGGFTLLPSASATKMLVFSGAKLANAMLYTGSPPSRFVLAFTGCNKDDSMPATTANFRIDIGPRVNLAKVKDACLVRHALCCYLQATSVGPVPSSIRMVAGWAAS